MGLKKFENSITSQWGEDGVIEEIFNRIGDGNKLVVEFGAWDGKHLSNCWDLWNNKNWSAVLIEGDQERADQLKEISKSFPKLKAVQSWVEIEGENSLDSILDRKEINDRIDLLSIDIDSDDYAVFKSLKRKPRVVIIEYNPTIPPHIKLVQKPGWNLGNSINSTYELAREKGYKLAHLTYTNLILVDADEFDKLSTEEVDFWRAFPYDKLTCIINTYEGDTIMSQPMPYNSYLEPVDVGVRNYLKRKYLGADKPEFPEFESDHELVHCKIISKKK